MSLVGGVFPEHVAAMARIDVTPTWVKIHDFETRIPQAVEDLARAKPGGS